MGLNNKASANVKEVIFQLKRERWNKFVDTMSPNTQPGNTLEPLEILRVLLLSE